MKNIIDSKYILEAKLGEGENDVIYDALDLENKKHVAIKKILGLGELSGTIETQVSTSFNHKNIVKYLDVIEEKKVFKKATYYVVMDLIDGISLLPIINYIHKENIGLADDLAVYIIVEILDALDYLHNFNSKETKQKSEIVHGDISPSNIMINRNGEVKLIDFGISKYFPDQIASKKKPNRTIKGKIHHLSPEQAAGMDIDRRSDLYSTGVVLFELLTGINPLGGHDKSTAEAVKYLKEEGISENSIKEKIHNPLLQSILVKVLSKERRDRFQTANELKRALLPIVNFNEKEDIQEEIACLVNELYSIKSKSENNESTKVKGLSNGRSSKRKIIHNVIIGFLAISGLIILGNLQKAAGNKKSSGNIYVSTIPENSSIEFNHKIYKFNGTEPIYIKNIKTGHYPLKCTHKDYGEIVKVVSITPKSAKKDEHYVIVNTQPMYIMSRPDGAKIFINGSQIEKRTNCRIDLPIDKDVNVRVENEHKIATCNINILNGTYSVDSSCQWHIFQNSWVGFNSADSTMYLNMLVEFGKVAIIKTVPQVWQLYQNGKAITKLPDGNFVVDGKDPEIIVEIQQDSLSTIFEKRNILLNPENDTIVLNFENEKTKKSTKRVVQRKVDLSKLKENIVEISINVKNENDNVIPQPITINYVRIKNSFGKEVKEPMKTYQADTRGYFAKFIPAGRYRFRFSAAGYSTLDKFISLNNNQKKSYTINLKKN